MESFNRCTLLVRLYLSVVPYCTEHKGSNGTYVYGESLYHRVITFCTVRLIVTQIGSILLFMSVSYNQ